MNVTALLASVSNLGAWIRAGFNNHKVRLDSIDENKANIRFGQYVSSSTELTNAKNSAPSQETVFNTWYRFSHGADGNFPSAPAELTSWAYNSGTGKISNTTNSGTFIGVVSKEKYSDYTFDVKLASTNVDDDNIGILLAWYKDPDTGREYTLSAIRSPGGSQPLYGVMYNMGQTAPWGVKTVAAGNATVTWGNGASGALSAAAAGWVSNTPGWGGMAAAKGTDGTVRIWAERKGDIIKVKTAQWTTPDVLDEATLLTIDLSSDPDLYKFRGSSQYGLVSYSQQDSTWEITSFSNTKDAIYDMVTGDVWVNNAGTWAISATLTLADLGTNVLLVNTATSKMYTMKDDQTIVMFTGGVVGP